jgi:hypothetical protein
MFDRSNRTEGPVSVEITLTSGRQLRGKFVLPSGRTLPEALNGPSTFIEFEPEGDQRTFITKSALQSVKANEN